PLKPEEWADPVLSGLNTTFGCGEEGTLRGRVLERDPAVLRFAMAQDRPKLLRVPAIRLLKEAPPRAGFFEHERYEAVRRHLRSDLQVACDLGYTFGWRVRDEVLTLERRQMDLAAGSVRLDVGTTKNEDGRVVYLTPALRAGLAEQL